MHTLQQLRDGALAGAVSLKLSEDLSHFPEEIFTLADTLEILDLSGNRLNELPPTLGRLKKLRILFCSDNLFTELPPALAHCPLLDIVGFKANKIETMPPASINPNLRWLILTDNCITAIPAEIGNCPHMQKLMLAGNRLTTLPAALANCHNLSLLRISANRLTHLPHWLLTMPRLAWLACAGNPFSIHPAPPPIPAISWQQLQVKHILGQGASGIIYKAVMSHGDTPHDVAVKIFKGTVTSDGLPEDEMNAFMAAGSHTGMVQLTGRLADHPEGKMGLVMELIPAHYHNLGMPPTFHTCTRDVFAANMRLTVGQIVRIASTTASLALQLHNRGIMHGDLYAHNILTDEDGNTLLGDFGAAAFYSKEDTQTAHLLERIEVSAFGYLLDDLLGLCEETTAVTQELDLLRDTCVAADVSSRPSFYTVHGALTALQAAYATA